MEDTLNKKDKHMAAYDESYIYQNQPKEIPDLLHELIGYTPLTILTVGCGPGYIETPLVKMEHTVHGLDLNSDAEEQATENGLIYHVADIMKKDINVFTQVDWIIATDIFEHVTDPILLLNQLYKFLKPNGKVFLKSPNFGHYKFRYRNLRYGSLNTPYQIKQGHLIFPTYHEVIEFVKESKLSLIDRYCFSYKPVPTIFKYNKYLYPNITSLSTILVLQRKD